MAAEPLLEKADCKELYNTLIQYIFRSLNYRSFGARLTKLAGGQRPNVKAVVECLSKSGLVMKNLKCWVLYSVKNKLGVKDTTMLCKEWGLSPDDAVALTTSLQTKTLVYLKQLCRKYVALTPDTLDKHVIAIKEDIRVWLGKFVSKKLRFVYQSQGLERGMIESELFCRGIQGLYQMYPCVDSYLHAVNVVKRVIHNQGINMIHHYTTEKMGRLVKDDKGLFTARVVGLDEAQLNFIPAPPDITDVGLDLRRMQSQYTGKKRTFLELLCGDYNEAFTEHLRNTAYPSLDTNEDLLDKLPTHSYMELILGFLKVSMAQGQQFLVDLRVRLSDYKSASMRYAS